jgi:hypothetical protein
MIIIPIITKKMKVTLKMININKKSIFLEKLILLFSFINSLQKVNIKITKTNILLKMDKIMKIVRILVRFGKMNKIGIIIVKFRIIIRKFKIT